MNRLRKIFTITAVAPAAACLVLTSCAERTCTVTLLATNDTHGAVFPYG